VLGLLLGTVLFAGLYPDIEFLTSLGEYAKADALPDAFNISSLSINIGMVIAAVGVFVLGSWMESISKGPVRSQV
jgi:hypothetical protein